MVDQVLANQIEEEQTEEYNTADPEQVNTIRKKTARTRADRLKFVSAGMAHPQGRAWFYDIMSRCHIYENAFRDDPYQTAFVLGEQNIGRMILADVQDAAPEQYLLMLQENKMRYSKQKETTQ